MRICRAAASAAVASQIAWVLVPDPARDALTIASVLLFAIASLSHAAAARGARWAARYAAITLAVGWTAEAIGVRTGQPFGDYSYAGTLGPMLGPVPLIVPLAWTMMAYPVLLAARRVAARRAAQTLYAAALLAAWDLFLDPQMVAQGHWIWTEQAPALPGIPGIPIHNYAGWFAVGLVLFGLAARLLAQDPAADDRVPVAMLGWVLASNILANALFWGGPAPPWSPGPAWARCCCPGCARASPAASSGSVRELSRAWPWLVGAGSALALLGAGHCACNLRALVRPEPAGTPVGRGDQRAHPGAQRG